MWCYVHACFHRQLNFVINSTYIWVNFVHSFLNCDHTTSVKCFYFFFALTSIIKVCLARFSNEPVSSDSYYQTHVSSTVYLGCDWYPNLVYFVSLFEIVFRFRAVEIRQYADMDSLLELFLLSLYLHTKQLFLLGRPNKIEIVNTKTAEMLSTQC